GGGIAENGGVFLLLLSLGFGGVSVVIPLAGTAPLFVLALAYLFPSDRARLGWRIVAGVILIVLGVTLLSR
ncbi:MAG TPA: EamA family transporter, partial [Methylomirabilota bacterium]